MALPSILALSLAALPGAVAAAPTTGASGSPSVYLGVANLDPAASDAIEWIDEDGGTSTYANIPACHAAYVQVAGEFAPDPSARKALARMSRSGPIGLVVQSNWPAGGATVVNGGTPSTRLLVPVAAIDYYGQDTSVTIRNATARDLTVTAELRASGSAQPVAATTLTIPARRAVTMDLSKTPAFVAVPRGPEGFLGALDLSADGEMAAWFTVDLTRQPLGVWAVEALRPEDAAGTLVAPLVRHRWNGYDTGIAVANPGSVPVTVDVAYHASPELMGPMPVRLHGARTIPAGGSTVFYQGPGGGHGLPERFVGSAVIEASDGAVMAIVNDAFELGRQSAAYVAQPIEAAAERLFVPAVKNHFSSAYALTTGIQVMNPGTVPARVRLNLLDSNGVSMPCLTCEVEVAPGGSHAFVMGFGGLMALPYNSYGSGEVVSDVPIMAVVNDVSLNGRMDATAYNALPCGSGGPSLVALP